MLCWAAIDEAAHQTKADDPTRGIDQCRAEALADLILARVEVSAHVIIPLPVSDDADPHDGVVAPPCSTKHQAGAARPSFGRPRESRWGE